MRDRGAITAPAPRVFPPWGGGVGIECFPLFVENQWWQNYARRGAKGSTNTQGPRFSLFAFRYCSSAALSRRLPTTHQSAAVSESRLEALYGVAGAMVDLPAVSSKCIGSRGETLGRKCKTGYETGYETQARPVNVGICGAWGDKLRFNV